MPAKKIFDIYPPKQRPSREAVGEKTVLKGKNQRTRKSFFFDRTAFLLKISNLKNGILFLFLMGLAGLFISLYVFANAEIKIWPKTEIISFEKKILVDVNILEPNIEDKDAPGQFFSEEKEEFGEFSATGVFKKSSKAEGIVKVINNYDLAQILVKNTRFLSADGKLFYSQEYLNIPPGGSREAAIQAAEPGPDYNIKPSTFSIPGLLGSPRYTSVYAKSFSQMKGGEISEGSQVTQDDLGRAENILFDKVSSFLEQRIRERGEPFFVLLDKAIEIKILEKSSSKQEGEEGNKFNFYVKAQAKGLAFKKSDIDMLAEQWTQDKTIEGYKVIKDDIEISFSFEKIDLEKGTLSVTLGISAKSFAEIEIEEMKRALSGKSVEESRMLLASYEGIEKSRLRVFPFWIKAIPENLNRIKIKMVIDPAEKI